MDWKLFLSTFAAVFVAEMGDKTQIATLTFSASGSRWAVFAGSATALVATSAIAVLVGGLVARVVSPHWIRRAAGAVFILLGLLYLLGRTESGS
ncbi:MAG: TMEM165/GDT1 family protein [Pseudomonadota bacterium]